MKTLSLSEIKQMAICIEVISNNQEEFFDFPASPKLKNPKGLIYLTDDFVANNVEIPDENWGASFITPASLLLIKDNVLMKKTFFVTENPKLTYAKLYNELFFNNKYGGVFGEVHETAYIDPTAFVDKGCFVGPKCTVGANTYLGPNSVLVENVEIGKNVKIGPGTVIGSHGFGYVKNEIGDYIPFPQIGGVVIGDNVEVGANSAIDSGSLEATVICAGVKIDNLVHVAHNVRIGKNSIIAAGVIFCGSTHVGENCWIAPGAMIREQLEIGNNVFIGLGAVVVKNLKSDSRVAGNPARELPQK
jgi:UDP-3-O-[3-hydroxymyristoyl] glucosamine N-acyltransferase